jgi:glycosyltransferase involved in cell wall biosynthesis
MKINVLAKKNGVGLQKDQEILCGILREAGHEVDENDATEKSLYFRMRGKPHYDLNIFCQHLNPLWFNAAKANWLIPNQELFPQPSIKYLTDVSLVLCKSRYAEKIFQDLGCKTVYTSFTSVDRWKPEILKVNAPFLHLSGKSPFKGTEAVIEAWRENPDFPEVIIFEHQWQRREDPQLKNVRYIFEYLPEERMSEYLNQCAYHLCPSIVEGFGHYIMEGLSCKSLVIATDAPPMNELVSPERGLLCPYQTKTVGGLGHQFFVNPKILADKIREMLSLSDEKKHSFTENARKFFLENDQFFKHTLLNLVTSK